MMSDRIKTGDVKTALTHLGSSDLFMDGSPALTSGDKNLGRKEVK